MFILATFLQRHCQVKLIFFVLLRHCWMCVQSLTFWLNILQADLTHVQKKHNGAAHGHETELAIVFNITHPVLNLFFFPKNGNWNLIFKSVDLNSKKLLWWIGCDELLIAFPPWPQNAFDLEKAEDDAADLFLVSHFIPAVLTPECSACWHSTVSFSPLENV